MVIIYLHNIECIYGVFMKLLATIQERLLSAPADLRPNKPRTFLLLFGFAIGFLPSSASLQ